MRENPTDRIARLQAKRKQIAVEIRAEQARRRRQKRRDGQRRAVLIGQVTLQRIDDRKFSWSGLQTMMGEYLKRPADRALFDLPPLPDDD